eukprot:CFRG8658
MGTTYWHVALLWVVVSVFFLGFSLVKTRMDAIPLDAIWERTAETTLNHIDSFGEQGRLYYGIHVILDTFFPPVYGLAIHTTLAVLLRTVPSVLTSTILVGCIADGVENGMFTLLLLTYPERHETIAAISCVATKIKFIGLAIGLCAVALALLYKLFFYQDNKERLKDI